MEHLQMDLIDMSKFEAENNGYCWILTVVDVFSKYLWAIPLFKKDQASVCSALLQLFVIIGTPEILQSDNGKEFVGGVIKSLCEMLRVSSIFGFNLE
jgi:transposase InsO family protein